MEPYLVPKDWLVVVALFGVGTALALPLTQQGGWIGWAGIAATVLMASPVVVFASYCCFTRLCDIARSLSSSSTDESESEEEL